MPVNFDKQNLTPNFRKWEFTVSETAARLDIVNSPSPGEWDNLRALSENCLEPAHEACGPLQVTSGFRCFALNKAIGGAANSQHMLGEAADIIPYHGSLSDLFKWIYFSDVPFDQLLWEFGSWVHVSHVKDGAQRHQALIASKVNGNTAYAAVTKEQVRSF
jgi:hypothetical protein